MSRQHRPTPASSPPPRAPFCGLPCGGTKGCSCSHPSLHRAQTAGQNPPLVLGWLLLLHMLNLRCLEGLAFACQPFLHSEWQQERSPSVQTQDSRGPSLRLGLYTFLLQAFCLQRRDGCSEPSHQEAPPVAYTGVGK